MVWSKYNYLYESARYGYFLYNSRTNSFLSISKDLFESLNEIKNDRNEINVEDIDKDIVDELIKAKVIVHRFDDNNYVNQKKYLKYLENFNTRSLGLVIVPTCACNFSCPYCYEHNLPVDIMNEKVEDQVLTFIQSFKESKNLHICWHGGEPLIAYDSMKRLLNKIKNDKSINLTVHSLVTNGYLFDEEKCDFFNEHHLGSVQITIDGLPETHNKSRIHKAGLPTYDRIISNIETIFRKMPNCHVIVRMNVHEQNKEECPILYKELSKKWEGNNFSIVMVYATEHEGCKVACIKDKQRVTFARELYKVHNIKNINFYPRNQLGGCTADHVNTFIIGPKGELYKCWVDVGKQDRVIGHIDSEEVNSSLLSEYIIGTDMYSDEKCLSCFLFPVCDGGCGLFRLEHKLYEQPYNVCPIQPEDISIMLDTFYEQKVLSQRSNS